MKGVHGMPAPEEPESTGDRDTPTRAIALDALPRAAPMLDTPTSPVVPVPVPAPRFGAPPDPLLATAPMPRPPLPGPAPFASPAPPQAKMTMPLGDFMRGAPPPPSSAQPGPPKPAWQEKLDRALIAMGRFGELQAQRYRSAPPSTQLAVKIAAGAMAALVLVVLIVLAVH